MTGIPTYDPAVTAGECVFDKAAAKKALRFFDTQLKFIKRHFTLDRNMEGPDHAASLEFNEFKELIQGIREV